MSLQKPVYRVSTPEQGVNVRRWTEAPDALPHDNVDSIWTGAVDTATGFPSHPNAPTVEAVENDFSYTGPDDQIEAWAWITFDEPTYIRDSNSNTGERGEVWIKYCNGTPTLIQKTVVDTATERGILSPVLIPAGTHMLYVRQSDFSANQGFNLQTSVDGENDWINFRGEMYATAPVIECQLILACDDIPEGFTLCRPNLCAPLTSPPAPTVIPEQEICNGPFVDVTSRTGWAFPWTTNSTANTGTVQDDWVQISTAEVSPDCATDITVVVDGGEIYHQIANARAYHWIDFRLLIDGVAVVTNTYDNYLYLDERVSTATVAAQPTKIDIQNSKQWVASRNNVPAGSTITVEMRRRYNHNGFQEGGRVRTIGGLRAKAIINYFPRNIVTGRV